MLLISSSKFIEPGCSACSFCSDGLWISSDFWSIGVIVADIVASSTCSTGSTGS